MDKEKKDMKEIGKFEKEIHSKLYDFEADTQSDDWEAIAGRLSGGKSVAFHSYRKYLYAAAAIACVLLVVGGLFFIHSDRGDENYVAVVEKTDSTVDNSVKTVDLSVEKSEELVEKPVEKIVDKIEKPVEKTVETTKKTVNKSVENLFADVRKRKKKKKTDNQEKRDTVLFSTPPVELKPMKLEDADTAFQKKVEEDRKRFDLEEKSKSKEELFVADASAEIKKHRRSRWGFGMGGGSIAGIGLSGGDIAVSSQMDNATFSIPTKVSDDYMFNKQSIILRNGLRDSESVPVDNEDMSVNMQPDKHKTPISVGLGVSYFLTDRWSLHSGLVYTLLRSEGQYLHSAGKKTELCQKLHYVGIPVSLSYKIAQWNKFRVYANGGGMVEKNVAGNLKKTTIGAEGLPYVDKENLHMKELMWSLNARAGVSYPVWKFINVYAEAGCSYYFDNKSSIETIRSSKPFNVSLQAGISLGF